MGLSWQRNRLLSEFSTFGIGGPISFFASITNLGEMEEAFHFIREKKLPFFVLGKGSNCLFDDAGFDGVVLLNRIDFLKVGEEGRIEVGAGTSFSLLGSQTARKGLKGLEFASGIPASVGGAIYMNAGANGRETKEMLKSVTYLESTGEKREFQKEDLFFNYRTSSFQTMSGAIISATFQLEVDPTARQRQLEIIERRMETQPLKEKSAGCVFRNPASHLSAGALIDQCGLKGFQVGDATVSKMHANFLINQGNASFQDVQTLIGLVQEKVFEKTGVHLEPEIRIIGRHG